MMKKHVNKWIAPVVIVFLMITLIAGCSLFEGEDFDLGYKVYVPNLGNSTITVIPEEDSMNTDIIDVRRSIRMIALRPNSSTLLTLLSGTNEIIEISTTDDTIGETFRFEVGSVSAQLNNRIVFAPGGAKAYVSTSFQPAGIAVMNLSDYSFSKGINVNSTSVDRFLFASGGIMYATDPQRGYIYEINTTTDEWQREIRIPETFGYTIYNSRTGTFLMAGVGTEPGIKEFDPVQQEFLNRINSVTDRIIKLHISQDENLLYVLGNSEIVTVNLNNFIIRERVPLQYHNPADFRFLPDSTFILVPSINSRSVMVIDPDNLETETTINTGETPGEAVIIPTG
jgi:DNA-binding beta-propeller fold protein YncE